MDVRRHREGGGVVPEPHLHLLRVQAELEQPRRAGVSERVEASPLNTGAASRRLEDATGDVPRVKPLARPRGEHGITI
jgi:hypothetical protein